MRFPLMMRVEQHINAPVLGNVEKAVHEEIAKLDLSQKIKPEDTVAVPVGSRGIRNIALIVKTLVDDLKALGAKPFIVPAMGSHGGGVAEVQRSIVEGYGVTEDYIGAPIKASMEVVQVGATEDGVPVFFDKHASEADHVAVVARVKPHTDFTGEIESGLNKMTLIGLGKHEGAKVYHKAFIKWSFDHIVRSVARNVIKKCNIVLGLAIVENQLEQTALIQAVRPEEFLEREIELLKLAKQWLPRIPYPDIDLLIIDEIGKNISGTGMDSNVIGRKYHEHCAAPDELPRITRIYVRDLTEETHGNATGIGMADYTTKRLVENADWNITYINCLTGNRPALASIPIPFENDREALEKGLLTVGYKQPEDTRIVRIRNTLDTREVWASKAYLAETESRDDLSIIQSPIDMTFDEVGNLTPF
ncbi:MAG: nickel-dependent lactate racemase [Deltaproteobacteria bacterium]|nr:nickel-dependent lactate racemase [Deltaproteobacteria bacterium]